MNAPVFGSLFSGVGMLDYGLELAGIQHAWFCEVDPWRRGILRKRWPGLPVYDDVRTVGAGVPPVTGIIGGFPCKGASTAGKQNGFDHPETVLWREMWRIIGELRPRVVVIENVANLLAVRAGAVWGEVLRDLAALGFDAVWDCVPAAAFGAPHLRDRVICIATHPDGAGWQRDTSQRSITDGRPDARGGGHDAADATGARPEGARLRGRLDECGDAASADTDRNGVREQSVAERGRSGSRVATAARGVASDTSEERRDGRSAGDSDQPTVTAVHARRLGVPVEWGRYEGAIRRWEQIHGPAPEPICAFRGVDARAAGTVDRSRVSAVGDGVQVQLGELVGRYLMSLENAERMAA